MEIQRNKCRTLLYLCQCRFPLQLVEVMYTYFWSCTRTCDCHVAVRGGHVHEHLVMWLLEEVMYTYIWSCGCQRRSCTRTSGHGAVRGGHVHVHLVVWLLGGHVHVHLVMWLLEEVMFTNIWSCGCQEVIHCLTLLHSKA